MQINMTDKALEFLRKTNTNELYIELIEIQQCCITLVTPPVVRKGAPNKPDMFHKFVVNGITVYYDRRLILKTGITVEAQGISFMKGLIVSDWEIKY